MALKDNNNEEVSKDRWWAPIYLVICVNIFYFLGYRRSLCHCIYYPNYKI